MTRVPSGQGCRPGTGAVRCTEETSQWCTQLASCSGKTGHAVHLLAVRRRDRVLPVAVPPVEDGVRPEVLRGVVDAVGGACLGVEAGPREHAGDAREVGPDVGREVLMPQILLCRDVLQQHVAQLQVSTVADLQHRWDATQIKHGGVPIHCMRQKS